MKTEKGPNHFKKESRPDEGDTKGRVRGGKPGHIEKIWNRDDSGGVPRRTGTGSRDKKNAE